MLTSMKFAVVTDGGALEDLRAEWEALWSVCPGADVFCTWAWFCTWWSHFGAQPGCLLYHRQDGVVELPYRRATLHVATLRNVHGELLALAPWIRVKSRWRRWPVRVLSPPLNGHAPRSGMLARTSGAAAALGDALLRGGTWDLLLIDGYAQHGDGWPALDALLARSAGPVVDGAIWRHLILPMHGSFAAHLHSRRGHFRKRERQAWLALDELGLVDVTCHRDADALAVGLPKFVAVDAQSWKARSGETLAGSPIVAAYYTELARRFAQRGGCHVWVLSIGGQPAAAFLVLCGGALVYLIKISQDQRFASARHAPSRVLLAHLIRSYWEQGVQVLDFVGDMPFVERWTDTALQFSARAVFAPAWYARLVHATERLVANRQVKAAAGSGAWPCVAAKEHS